jgi:heme-degrading monooxygenase HmoA
VYPDADIRRSKMFAVIFEVNPKPDAWDSYLGYARLLRPELERVPGFIDNERFSSMRRPGWLLSLSIWQDEAAVIRWRSHAGHHEIQQKGREEVFRDYHLRVGEIIGDSHSPIDLSSHERRFEETQAAAKVVALCEGAPEGLPADPDAAMLAARLGAPDPTGNPGLLDWDVFESIYQLGKFILVVSWHDTAAAERWPAHSAGDIRYRRVRVVRDYGMFDRAEAPQYYRPVLRERPGS